MSDKADFSSLLDTKIVQPIKQRHKALENRCSQLEKKITLHRIWLWGISAVCLIQFALLICCFVMKGK